MRTGLALALLLGSVGVARAQAAPAARAPAPAAAEHQQVAGLELSAEQKVKLEAITTKYARENRAVGDLTATDPAAAMTLVLAIRERMLPEVRAVLTPGQRAIFDRNMAAMKTLMDARAKSPR